MPISEVVLFVDISYKSKVKVTDSFNVIESGYTKIVLTFLVDLTMSVVIPITLLAILVGLYITFLKWRHNYWARKGAPQMPPDLLFGNFTPLATGKQAAFDFFRDIYFYGKKTGNKFLGLYSVWTPQLVVIDKDLMKTVLTKDFEYFGSHGTYQHKNEPLTIHLFNMEGQEWKDRRVKMTPLFTTGRFFVN